MTELHCGNLAAFENWYENENSFTTQLVCNKLPYWRYLIIIIIASHHITSIIIRFTKDVDSGRYKNDQNETKSNVICTI
jgi:hypothetical protein